MRLMSNTKIHDKTGIIWYRRAVPTALRGRCPAIPGFPYKPDRRELTKTLQTRSEAEANRRAALIDIEVEKAFERALSPSGLTPAQKSVATPVRITPAIARNAIAKWRIGEIDEIRLRAFNEEKGRSRFEAVCDFPDGAYLVQQYAQYPRPNGELWQRIPDFDELLVSALTSQGVSITTNHPAIAHIRPVFAEAWDMVLNASFRVSRSPAGVWDETCDLEDAATREGKEGTPSPLTPFAAHLDEWIAAQREMKPRQRDRYAQVVRDFAAFEGGVFIEQVRKPQVHRYATSLIADGGKELTTKTVRSILAALRSYWDYLHVNEFAGESTPFHGLRLMKRSGVKIGKYLPEQVLELWRRAIANDDSLLADLIRLAAFTGSRIEAMCQLKEDDVRFDPDSACRFIHISKDKTEAGVRDVPIHSAVAPLIDRYLKTAAERDGFLFPTTSDNKYGERSSAAGKRFGRLKTKLGFGAAYNFHSFRHTVAHLFERAKISEGVAADIMGHRKPTMTYGLYAGETYMGDRQSAIETALSYPSQDFMTAG
jgi:integrase